MIAHYVLEPDKKHGMDVLAKKYLQYETISIETLIGKKGKNQCSMDSVEPETVCPYAAEDADITFQLKHILEKKLKEEDLYSLFMEVELPVVEVLYKIEKNGVKIDLDGLISFSHELEGKIQETKENIFSLSAVPIFNLNSPKQLGQVLFEKMKITDKVKKTKTKQYSTSEETLLELQDTHEIIGEILNYREFAKLKNTYVDVLPKLSDEEAMIHASFNQAVASTGRLSSSNPNLQNIPIKTEQGRKIRQAFISSFEGGKIVSADYSQIELRVMAEVCGDPSLKEAFLNNADIHTNTASKIFEVSPEEVTPSMRSKAKVVNFSILYGVSAFGLARNLKIPRSEAAEMIEQYFLKFSKIKEYMDSTIEFARSNGYVFTHYGRKRYLADINSGNRTVRGHAERNAINAPIQGTAADIIKKAMIQIDTTLSEKKLSSKMILQVHDELVFDVAPDEVEIIPTMVKKEMENAVNFSVPLVVSIGSGNNWLEAH